MNLKVSVVYTEHYSANMANFVTSLQQYPRLRGRPYLILIAILISVPMVGLIRAVRPCRIYSVDLNPTRLLQFFVGRNGAAGNVCFRPAMGPADRISIAQVCRLRTALRSTVQLEGRPLHARTERHSFFAGLAVALGCDLHQLPPCFGIALVKCVIKPIDIH